MTSNRNHSKAILDAFLKQHVSNNFIANDPICIPHRFSNKKDIEISAFFSAIFAWGRRATIISKAEELMQLMDNAPYDFIQSHTQNDLKSFTHFTHRTFQATDLLYFIDFLQRHYKKYPSLEDAFTLGQHQKSIDIETALIQFNTYFFDTKYAPDRTRKHIATPAKNATCKRLNMFLRWMVRRDEHGIDFGIWNKIKPADLYCPFDVHVERTARKLGLIQRKQNDWQTVKELTIALREFDIKDPIKYDFALFGLGVHGVDF